MLKGKQKREMEGKVRRVVCCNWRKSKKRAAFVVIGGMRKRKK